jgi:hypothetical protein
MSFREYIRSLLSKSTENILSSGGDDRLTLDKLGLNKYLCSYYPTPDIIRRSSCTSSTIDISSFRTANSLKENILTKINNCGDNEEENIIENLFEDIRQCLKDLLYQNSHGMFEDSKDDIILFPSGSDAEYLPLIFGLVRSFNLSRSESETFVPKVYNFVTGANEVGSGTPNASEGKHFSKISPTGVSLTINERLNGLKDNSVELIQYKPRGSNGSVQFRELELIQEVRDKLGMFHGSTVSVAIVHVVLGTKTGLIYPSFTTINKLCQEFGDRIVITIDACQFRCQISYIQQLTSRGYLTLITGSKFFTAPPFW